MSDRVFNGPHATLSYYVSGRGSVGKPRVYAIPALPHGCNSWIVVDRETEKAVLETFSYATVCKVNQERYAVFTALAWLQRLNASLQTA